MKSVEENEIMARLEAIAGRWVLEKLRDHGCFFKRAARANKSAMCRALGSVKALDELFERFRAELGENLLQEE